MKDCARWRRSECPGDESCCKWERCTLMNPDAKTPSFEDLKDAD